MENEEPMQVDHYNLSDFPDEILLHIFGYFDDQTLLSVTRVCKRFKRLTESAVAEKYDGKYEYKFYEIEEFQGTKKNGKNEIKQHYPFLNAFASKIIAVRAIFLNRKADQNHWIIRLLKRHLKSVSKVSLEKSQNCAGQIIDDYAKLDLLGVISLFSMLDSLELFCIESINPEWAGLHIHSLLELDLNYCSNLGGQTFQRFLNNNPQLELIRICNTANINIDYFNNMPNLRHLNLDNDGDADESMALINEESKINLPNLRTISTDNRNNNLFEMIAVGCKNIKTFRVSKLYNIFEINDHQVNMVCSLKKLSNISMAGVHFNSQQVKKMIGELPNLKRLEFAYNGDISFDNIGSILEKTRENPKLHLINIQMETTRFENLPVSKIHQMFKHFASPNVTLMLDVDYWKLKKTVIITNENVSVDGKLVYWTGDLEIMKTSKQLDFIQLKDKCLEIVINQLSFGDQLALYQTCGKMQQIIGPKMKDKFTKKPFTIQRDIHLEETYLRYFGKYISGICFDLKICHGDQATKHWNLIHRYCKQTLKELMVKHLKSSKQIKVLNDTGLQFPNLEKLVFVKSNLFLYHPSKWNYSFCPKLTHLEFDQHSEINMDLNTNLTTVFFENLTTLRFGWFYDENVLFLRALSQSVCENLRELSLVNIYFVGENDHNPYKFDHDIANTVARFRKLEKLDLILDGILQTNMKFLFERCSNLVEISIFLVQEFSLFLDIKKLEIIKKSCIHLKKLKLVIKRSEKEHFVMALRTALDIFPGISIDVLEMNGESCHHVKEYNLTYELLDRWDMSPIQTFLSATK